MEAFFFLGKCNRIVQKNVSKGSKCANLNFPAIFGFKIGLVENQIEHFKIYHFVHKNVNKWSNWHFYERFGEIW